MTEIYSYWLSEFILNPEIISLNLSKDTKQFFNPQKILNLESWKLSNQNQILKTD